MVWKCFQDRNFPGVIVGFFEQSIESWVGLLGVLEFSMNISPKPSFCTDNLKVNALTKLIPFKYRRYSRIKDFILTKNSTAKCDGKCLTKLIPFKYLGLKILF